MTSNKTAKELVLILLFANHTLCASFLYITGVFTNGGTQANIIPDSAALEFAVRTPTKKELEVLKGKVIGCFEGAARATGCTVPIGSDSLIRLLAA